MELRHLRYFIAVAEEGHITRAAERLGMQQPPLSFRIKAMERELDVQLFRRKARGVELTDAGRIFLDNARAILAHFERTFEMTRRTARGELGQICVGVTPMSTFHPFVSRAIRTFRDSFPLISLRLEEVISNELVDRVRNGRIDVAFTRTPVAHPDGLVVSSLLEEPLLLALPSDHALAGTSRPPGSGLIEATTAACHAAGFNPRIGQAAPRVTSAIGLVASGLGISLVPASLRHFHVDGMVYRRLKGSPQPKAILNLVSRRGDPSAVIGHFLHLVKRAAKSVVQADPGRHTRHAKKR
jgi:DNA-binding transcriptional LysR family regulator